MKHISLLLELGATAPFNAIHTSDTHLVFVNDLDDERKHTVATNRLRTFPHAAEYLEEVGKAADEDNAVILHTGDLIDFVSEGNLDAVKKFTSEHDVIMSAGNHEFSKYVGDAWEDAAYREQSLARVQAAYTNNIRMYARVINGIKFIVLDNGYYLFEQEQLEFLKKECADGLPAVLLMHTPLYTPALHRFILTDRHQPCGYLCGTPESETSKYEDYRRRQQTPDDVTIETVKFITECKNIKCLLTGHDHVDVISHIRPDLPQYTAGLDTIVHLRIS